MGPRSPSPRQRTKLGLVLLLVSLGALVALFWFPRAVFTSDPAASATAPASDLSDPGTNARRGAASPLSPSLAATVAENRVPGRMVFLEFELSRRGTTRLIGAQGAAGRAKPGALQLVPGQIRYDVYDQNGRLTFSGTTPDPLHQRLEHPAEDGSDRIAVTVVEPEQAPLFLRIPGEADAFALVLSRLVPSLAAPVESTWAAFASFDLSSP